MMAQVCNPSAGEEGPADPWYLVSQSVPNCNLPTNKRLSPETKQTVHEEQHPSSVLYMHSSVLSHKSLRTYTHTHTVFQ